MAKQLLSEISDHISALSERVGKLKFPVRAYLAGGMAVNYHTGSRMSRDVDIQWSHKLAIPMDMRIFEVANPSDPSDVHLVSMDAAFGEHLGTFHPDWKEDSEEIARFGDIVLHVISPLDLAVSKIGRFLDRDREDIEELGSLGEFTPDQMKQRFEEALEYYVGDTAFLRHNLKDALELVRLNEHDFDPTKP